MDNMDKQTTEEKNSFLDFFLTSVKPILNGHLGVIAGTLAGVILAVCILIFGFWNMMFVIILAAVGGYAGYKIERKEAILPSLPVFSFLADWFAGNSWGSSRNRWKKKRLQ